MKLALLRENLVISRVFVWNIFTHKTFKLPVFDLLKLFRSSISKSIEKPR